MKTTIAVETDKSFEQILEALQKSYLKNTVALEKIYKGKMIDIGFPLNFKDGDLFFNTSIGPMKRDQLAVFFTELKKSDTDLPEICLFFEIDAFVNNIKDAKDMFSSIDTLSNKTWDVFSSIKAYVLG